MFTLHAHKGLLHKVFPMVCDEVWLVAKGLTTLQASIRPLSWVSSPMQGEVWLTGIDSPTLLAHKSLLSRMCLRVLIIVWPIPKLPPTLLAPIRLFSQVYSLMYNEVWLAGVSSFTLLAHRSSLPWMCPLQSEIAFMLKPVPCSLHTKGFSPECILWCAARYELLPKPSCTHCTHRPSLLCVFMVQE
jgi:hypothetical protein